MKPRKNQSSFNKKHPEPTYTNRNSKTQLDYYENYPYLIPPYALNGYQPYTSQMPMYPPPPHYHTKMRSGAQQGNMLAPPGMLPQSWPGMFQPGMMYPGYGHLPHPGYNFNKLDFVYFFF